MALLATSRCACCGSRARSTAEPNSGLELTTGRSRVPSFPLGLELQSELSFFPLLSKPRLRSFKAGSCPAGNAVSWKAAIPQPDFRAWLTGAHNPANRISVFNHGVLVGRNRAQDEVVGSPGLGRVRFAIAPPLLDHAEKKNKARDETQNGDDIEDHSKPPTQREVLTGRCGFPPCYGYFAFSPSSATRRMALGARPVLLYDVIDPDQSDKANEDQMDSHREAHDLGGKRQEHCGDHGSDREQGCAAGKWIRN